MLPLLIIDNDLIVIERETAAWEKFGAAITHVTSMQEAIMRLEKGEDFLLVSVNADNVDYLPQLRIMREIASVPIFIMSSDFSTETEVEALDNGADVYTQWRENSDDNVKSALAYLKRCTERHILHKKALKLLYHGNVMMVLDYHKVFIGSEPLVLSKLEFDILYHFMLNCGSVLTYRQIYENIYGREVVYHETAMGMIFNIIKRLRKKIRKTSHADTYIENLRGVGYRMLVKS